MNAVVEVSEGPGGATGQRIWPVGRARKAMLSVHVVTSSALIGADAVVLSLRIAGLTGDPVTVYPAMHVVAGFLMAPLALIALASGLVLAWRSRWRLFRYWWVTLKLVITTAGTSAILLVLVRSTGRAADIALGLAGGVGSGSINRIVFVLIAAVTTSLLVLNAVLGVTKPGWRTRRSTRP